MQHFILPTAKNNHRAWLLKTPVLALFALAIFLINTTNGIFPVAKVYAAINTDNLLALHNQERANAGLGALTISPTLNYSAQLKAQAMLDSNCWSHYCPDGKSPWDFFDQAGYNYMYAGENLAEGFFNDEDVMNAWMNSPTHRENILKPEYQEVGFGVVTGNYQGIEDNVIIVVHFGTRQGQQASVQQAETSQPQFTVDPPTITSPADGAILNKSEFDITGNAPNAEQVDLTKNDQTWGTTDANQGAFTFRAAGLVDGTYKVNANSRAQGVTSAASSDINFTIDLTPDPTIADSIVVSKVDDKFMDSISIHQPNLKSLVLEINNHKYIFTGTTGDLWVATIPDADFDAQSNFKITNTDIAGNIWSGTFDSSTVSQQVETLVPSKRSAAIIDFSHLSKSEVDFIALGILILLFGLDFITLARTGITRKGSKSHLHFAMMLIIGLIAITGTFSGIVGSGIGR